MKGCLRAKGPRRSLPEAAARWEKGGGEGLGSISDHIGLCSLFNYGFLKRAASGALLAAAQGGLVNSHS